MWYNSGGNRRKAVDISNAKKFIESYNRIDAQLRELYGYKPSQSFTDIVRRSAEKNAVVRKYESELADYARLRNAIVHQSTGEYIAVPCDGAVNKISRIEKLLCAPPEIGTLPEKKIVSIEAGLSLRQAVLLVSRTGHSNLPVYSGKRMVGILNNRRIVRALGAAVARGAGADAFLSQTPVEDILEEDDLNVYYKYLSRRDSLLDVLNAFENNKKLIAVAVSENGRRGERILNFITEADLMRVSRAVEDYE